MDIVHVKWNGERRFVGWDSAGHGVVMDAPGGEGPVTGVRPIEAALYALGGCTGIDVIDILRKKRQDVTDFEVIVRGRQREEQPRRYERIEIEYVVTGRGVKPVAVERSIELSEDKYCSVRAMIDPSVEMTSSYRIVEAPAVGEPSEGA
jgi:putative redox protein